MIRWDNISTSVYYRDKFEPSTYVTIKNLNHEFDYYAYKYLGTELAMYKILDTNFVDYIEKRGNVSKMKNIRIPSGL